MDFLTGCQHFGHRFICDACDRPFKSINQMDKTMLRNYARVKDTDTLFLLGDFAYRNARPASSYLKQIKKTTCGQMVYVRGNHDQWLDDMSVDEKQHYFLMVIDDRCVIERDGFRVGLCHIPTDQFQVPVDLIVCSHIHNNKSGHDFERFMEIPNILNCGVDISAFAPVTLREMADNNRRFYGRKYDIPEELFRAFE